jgi:hypothetical protein
VLEKADGKQTRRDQLMRGGQSLSENRNVLQPKDFQWFGTRRPSKIDVWKYFGFITKFLISIRKLIMTKSIERFVVFARSMKVLQPT